MGRKIPGKKHHGVKDPYKQQAQRFSIIKTKINNPPVDPDDQPVPRRVQQLMNWKVKVENKSIVQKKIEKIKLQPKKKHIDFYKTEKSNPLKRLKKLDGETNKSFNMRINEALKDLKKERSFKDINSDIPEENISEEKKIKHRRRKKNVTDEPHLTKFQKRALKEKEIKEKHKMNKEFEERCAIQRDEIKFGEIVHEPPSLKIKPRKAEHVDGAPRPGRKNLLLNKIFNNENENPKKSFIQNNKIKSNIDLKGKRKDLPENVRKRLEDTRIEAIEAYRTLKLTKRK